jgi:hypothetical protein
MRRFRQDGSDGDDTLIDIIEGAEIADTKLPDWRLTGE